MDVIFVPQNNFVRTLVNAGAGVLFGGVYIKGYNCIYIFREYLNLFRVKHFCAHGCPGGS